MKPSAGGSGIPEVSAYLNGTYIPYIFNMGTLLVKFVSCVCAIGCGMPVGPEAPMIHMGWVDDIHSNKDNHLIS